MALDTFDATQNQPAPKNDPNAIPIHWKVIHDMAARQKDGARKYGSNITAHNGRSALIDAYQELLDLCVYIRQLIEENEQLSNSLSERDNEVSNQGSGS